ncbi:MAG: error-prone DNA polymerase [Candidatus Obscuribacterales bacterium]|nr:error-prone DNA polymerase [Candidatus Obscuribacterales bacterium]
MQYAELHCHSAFSLLDGASNPEELVQRAKLIGLSALALTDHDDLGGAIRFAHAAKELNLNGIIGAELSLSGDEHLIVLAKNLAGYKNICRLITKARMSSSRGMPRLKMEDLDNHSEGILALSGCPHGRVPSLIARGKIEEATCAAQELREIFKEDFFLELWDHNIAQESLICKHLYEISSKLSIPWLVTNNAHYAFPEKRIIHDVLLCLKHEVTLSTAGRRLRANGSWYLKSAREIAQQWQNYPEGLRNTLVAAERCEFRLGILKPELPQIDLNSAQNYLLEKTKLFPSRLKRGDPETGPPYPAYEEAQSQRQKMNALLQKLTWLGAEERYGKRLSEKQIKQLKHELDLIMRLDLAPYFLIMWDIIRFAQSQGIAVQGRGSAANSAVCYCLKITAVDPIEMDLLFERFISEDRNEPPDIDLDIAHQEREKVLQYVYQLYGREHAAMVCEHISYRGPSAVRDAARVFDFSPEQAEKLAAEARHHEAKDAAAALANGGAERAGLDPKDRKVQLLIQVVAGLHQLPRHRSIHVGGFVLSGEPIGSIVPVEAASMPGRTVIQWDKDDIDLAGLIKIDLLGLGMLTMIQEGLKLIKAERDLDIDLSQLDMQDPKIYEMMQKADTIGVFQVESRAQMSILPKIRPRCFYDIVVSIAIVRPGPIQGNIVHPYLRRRRGLEPIHYLHPSIEPILKRTLGVPLFQEQGMKLAVVAAGFTPSQADQLRRVMSHKRSMERMAEVCVQLADGMRKNGLSEEAIETITFQLKAFANYGFPESHAASFALLVFASAYIKVYYAPEFYCAILNAQPMGFYSPATLIRDAIRHNVEVRPVDLAYSKWDCSLEKKENGEPALRIGLRFVSGLGSGAQETLEKAWLSGGVFRSMEDVCRRSGLKSKDLERLASAGAFDSFCQGRRRALWRVLKLAKNKFDLPLLNLLKEKNPEKEETFLPEMNDLETTIADYNILGLSTGAHPMVFFRSWALKNRIFTAADLSSRSNGEMLTVAGSVICRQRPHTAKGFVFITLEDETGTANVIIRPQVFEEFKRLILTQNFIAISGRLQLEEGVVNLIADTVAALPRLAAEEEIPINSRNFH